MTETAVPTAPKSLLRRLSTPAFRERGLVVDTVATAGETRQLGDAESLIHQAHQFGAFTASGVVHLTGRLETRLLRRALDWLQLRHPLLRAHIVKRGVGFLPLPPFVYRKAYFTTLGTTEIPLRVIEAATSDTWKSVLQDELRTPIPSDKRPRMRVVLVRDPVVRERCQLVVSLDHAIADIKSAALIIRQLLEFLAAPHAASSAVRKGLTPALETLTRPKSDSGTRPYIPIIRLPVSRRPRGDVLAAVEVRRFSREETATIKAAIKDLRITMHGLATASVLKAVHDKFGMTEMTCLSSVDFRRQCRPALRPDAFGCFIDLLRTQHDIAQPLVSLAQDVTVKLVAAVTKDRETASVIKRPPLSTYWIEALPTLRNRWRFDGIAMTTAGELGIGSRYGDFTVDDISAMVSQDIAGTGAFGIAVEREGALELSLCFAPHCLPQEDAAEIADLAAAALRSIVRNH